MAFSYHATSNNVFFRQQSKTSFRKLLTNSLPIFRHTKSFSIPKHLTTSAFPLPAGSARRGRLMMMCNVIPDGTVERFDIPVSYDDSALVTVMTQVSDPQITRRLSGTTFRETDEGLCLCIIMHKAVRHNVKLSMKNSSLLLRGIKANGTPRDFYIAMPCKRSQPEDVKATVKNGELMITFANLKMEDIHKMCDDYQSQYQPEDVKAKVKNGELKIAFANLEMEDYQSQNDSKSDL